VKLATFNVNGVNARLPLLLQYLTDARPDVVCLQELKCPNDRFPLEAIKRTGYHALWHGQKSWNGVAILAYGIEPIENTRVLPGDPDDIHSRYLEAVVGDLVVGCLYLPNGNPVPSAKFEYKLRWLQRLSCHASDLIASGTPSVLAGDYNVIPTDLDVYAPERWLDDALFRPEVRDAYRRLLGQGWMDTLRSLYPDARLYTFWKYYREAFARDHGLRIDHVLVSPSLTTRLVAAGVDRAWRALPKASDHAPVWIELDV
jgi:exodeoxyribonuclease-3